MAAGRHNLSRRAVLGVGVGACAPFGSGAFAPLAAGTRFGASAPLCGGGPGAGSGRGAESVLRRRWERALAVLRRSEARLAGFKAAEATLPPERRAFPVCKDLEERFGDLNDLRYAALCRLLRVPAPDLPALALKLELAVVERAWELAGAEGCLAAAADDARRLSENLSL